MSWEEYAKIILGNKRVSELKKQYNLCTKKYTWGRYKNFINRLKKECKEAERLEQTIKAGYDKEHQIDFITINVRNIINKINYWMEGVEE